MPQQFSPEDFGELDLEIAGFRLWIHERAHPQCTDYWDGNWLRVTAHCGASGASVWAQGAILMTADIERFGEQCEALLAGEATEAGLVPLEPELCVTIQKSDRLGHLRLEVSITSDYLAQTHKMGFGIDQSYLPGIVRSCSRILDEYPVRRDW